MGSQKILGVIHNSNSDDWGRWECDGEHAWSQLSGWDKTVNKPYSYSACEQMPTVMAELQVWRKTRREVNPCLVAEVGYGQADGIFPNDEL